MSSLPSPFGGCPGNLIEKTPEGYKHPSLGTDLAFFMTSPVIQSAGTVSVPRHQPVIMTCGKITKRRQRCLDSRSVHLLLLKNVLKTLLLLIRCSERIAFHSKARSHPRLAPHRHVRYLRDGFATSLKLSKFPLPIFGDCNLKILRVGLARLRVGMRRRSIQEMVS